MKFIVEYRNFTQQHLLTYIPEECSFYMGKIMGKIDVELILNKISLAVSKNEIVHVSGFCGLDKSMKTNYKIPKFKKGVLKVEDNLKYGFAYGINDEDWPVYINIETGWICIGDPLKSEKAVEFINDCVAVLEGDKLVALWLKPKSLPYELYSHTENLSSCSHWAMIGH